MKRRLKAWGDTKIIPIASILVVNDQGQILLLQRHAQDLGGRKWGTPGGRLKSKEGTQTAALRELWEETGIVSATADLLGKHEVRMPHGTVHMTTFKLVIPGDIKVVIDPEEHHAYKWFNISDIQNAEDLLWGIPTILRDFRLLEDLDVDPTLHDGSRVLLLSLPA